MKNTTITITVNIATADKYEGNAEIKINLEEKDLTENPKHTTRITEDKMKNLLYEAIVDYHANNLNE